VKRRFWVRRLLALSLLVLALAAVLAIAGSSCGGSRRGGEVTIYIPPGSTTADIARMLHDEEVIDNRGDFQKKADEMGIDQQLKPGTYSFTRGEPLEEILRKLEAGEQAPEGKLTVPEGYSINDISELVAARTGISRRQYLQAAMTGGRSLPLEGAEGASDLEGFLFPSTYDLEPDVSAAGLVGEQLDAFREKTASLPWERSADLGINQYQALIVASMVEREARVPEERPLVAAVIYNRLDQGMKLEVDATVQYALGYWKTELTQPDLETDSPYNTRLYGGLPPGPICNPGLESIRAALEPARVDYLYYVATGDAEGHHFFTSSYEDFLAASGSG
jgi:UPF0755 protein